MGGKTRNVVFSTRFVAMLPQQVARFCCPSFRSFIPVNIFIIKIVCSCDTLPFTPNSNQNFLSSTHSSLHRYT